MTKDKEVPDKDLDKVSGGLSPNEQKWHDLQGHAQVDGPEADRRDDDGGDPGGAHANPFQDG